jgi:predicted RecB family nuclease
MVCQRIDAACAKTKRWGNFTDVQKKYVKDLLAYNEGDCRSTWLIAKRVGNFYASDN